MKRIKYLFLVVIIMGSCKSSSLQQLNVQSDLFPEGIAIDKETKTIFLSSLKFNKIVQGKLRENTWKDVIASKQHDYLPGFGMIIARDTLYALGNTLSKVGNTSILLMLNRQTGEFIKSFKRLNRGKSYLNDLVVRNNNEIFITDSEESKIYKLQRPHGKIEVYIEDSRIRHPNGITLSENNKLLYIASSKGIVILDIETKKILNEPRKTFSGIDGLKYYKNSLIGIVNDRAKKKDIGMFRFYLNKEGTAILKKKKIVKFNKKYRTPTTFDIYKDSIFFIINTQLENFDEDNMKALNPNLSEPYILLKKRIKNVKLEQN